MKKKRFQLISSVILMIFYCFSAFSQQWEGGTDSESIIWRTGLVGFGTDNPAHRIHLNDTTFGNLFLSPLIWPGIELPGTKMRFSNFRIIQNPPFPFFGPQQTNHSWDLRAFGTLFNLDYLEENNYVSTPVSIENQGTMSINGTQAGSVFLSPLIFPGVEIPGTKLRLNSLRITPIQGSFLDPEVERIQHNWDLRAFGNRLSMDYYRDNTYISSPLFVEDSKVTVFGKTEGFFIFVNEAGTKLRLTNLRVTPNLMKPDAEPERISHNWDFRLLADQLSFDYYKGGTLVNSPLKFDGSSNVIYVQGKMRIDANESLVGLEFYRNSQRSAFLQSSGPGNGNIFRVSAVDGASLGLYTSGDARIMVKGDGKVGIGTLHPKTQLDVNGTTSTNILKITGGNDVAEPFKIKAPLSIEPGMIVSIDPQNPGSLTISEKEYDQKVAGVISGANNLDPGIILSLTGFGIEGEYPVALVGKVYCWAETSNNPIQPGDLLTTSKLPGFAMKVTDYEKAQGAIIGKAMSRLDEGKGLVLVLVNLQ